MGDRVWHGMREGVLARQDRVDRLPARVVAFSRSLIAEEAAGRRMLIENEYFLKLSDPGFSGLLASEQLLWLALWSCVRNRSAGGRRFSFHSRKPAGGGASGFTVSLHTEKGFHAAVIACGPDEAARGEAGTSTFRVSTQDMERRPAAIAEEVFSFLEDRADADAAPRRRDGARKTVG